MDNHTCVYMYNISLNCDSSNKKYHIQSHNHVSFKIELFLLTDCNDIKYNFI